MEKTCLQRDNIGAVLYFAIFIQWKCLAPDCIFEAQKSIQWLIYKSSLAQDPDIENFFLGLLTFQIANI